MQWSKHSRLKRGQTEPLGTLVAVTAICLAVSVYAGFVTGLVPDLGTDRELAEVTNERVWNGLNEDGVYPSNTSLESQLSVEDLPQGHHVRINVTYAGSGSKTSRAQFDEAGHPVALESDPPPRAETFERPVPVQHRDGDIRPGKLTVVVWNE